MKQRYFSYVLILFMIPSVLWGTSGSREIIKRVSSYHENSSGNYGPGFYIVDASIKEASEVMLKKLGLDRELGTHVNSRDRIVVGELDVVINSSVNISYSFSEVVETFNQR